MIKIVKENLLNKIKKSSYFSDEDSDMGTLFPFIMRTWNFKENNICALNLINDKPLYTFSTDIHCD